VRLYPPIDGIKANGHGPDVRPHFRHGSLQCLPHVDDLTGQVGPELNEITLRLFRPAG
jgi:hypothetical protein